MRKHKHVGSSFDGFLEEEDILEDCKDEAAKRVPVWQLEKEMQKQHFIKEAFAQRIHISRAAVNRILS